ncbi:hypothetical protein GGI12_002271 [Dipsacomyces acuminosporus]|nr:hypothetical protein GGI12_002271 [Dipsacomyces acuminosporus]
MMQDAQMKQPLVLPGKAASTGGRSSVVDRVKWIEKTHGPGLTASPALGTSVARSRLKLPKSFESPEVSSSDTAANNTNSATQPASQISHDGNRQAEIESRIPRLADISTAVKPPLNLRTDTEKQQQQQQQQPLQMPSPVLSEKSAVDAAAAAATVSAPASTGVEELAAAVSSPLLEPATVQTPQATPIKADEANASLPKSSTASPTQPQAAFEKEIDEASLPTNYSDHMSGSMIAEAAPASKAATVPRACMDRFSQPRKSLGGIRGKSPSSIHRRRYDKAITPTGTEPSQQPQQHQHQPAKDLPKEAQDHPLSRFNSARLRANHSRSQSQQSSSSDGHENDVSSLLARLNELSASRPNIQDLVSNRASPKFVKRSQFYNTTELKANAYDPKSRSRRRYK